MQRQSTLVPSRIFSRLSSKQISSFDDDCNGDEALIRESTSNRINPHQCMYFSSSSASTFMPNSTESLRSYRLPLGKSKSKAPKLKKNDSDKIIGSNLSEGWLDRYKPQAAHLVYSLEALFLAMDEQMSKGELCKDKTIVSLRRILLLLMTIPLHPTTSHTFDIIPWRNFRIIAYDTTDDELTEGIQSLGINSKSSTSWLAELQYTGLKFEETVTSSLKKHQEATESESSFYTFTRNDLGTLPVYFTAEIDATIEDNCNLGSYIELKTHNKCTDLDYSLTKKLIQSWCQTKLVDGKYVTIGFRKRDDTNSHFKLAAIKTYNTHEIPDMVLKYPIYMDKEDKDSLITCQKLLKWYQVVLSWISQECTDETAYKLTFCNQKLTLTPVPSTSTIQTEKIPKWFREKYPTAT